MFIYDDVALIGMVKQLPIGRHSINGVQFVKIKINEEYRDHGCTTQLTEDYLVRDNGAVKEVPYGNFRDVTSTYSSEAIINFCKMFNFIPEYTVEEHQRISDGYIQKKIYLSHTKRYNFGYEVKFMRQYTVQKQIIN